VLSGERGADESFLQLGIIHPEPGRLTMPRRVKVCQQAVRSVVEMLEHRVLLTTIVGGGVDPVTGEPISNSLTYYDRAKHNVTISVGGNTTAEFIFARVPDMSNAIASLGDYVPPPPPNPPVPVDGKDLFSIYVSQADASSFITIAQETPAGLVPFTGDAGAFQVFGPNGLVSITPDANTGTIILGARGQATPVPIVSRSFQGAFGVRPDLGRVTAGLQVAPGLDFGKFFFGGTVLGQREEAFLAAVRSSMGSACPTLSSVAIFIVCSSRGQLGRTTTPFWTSQTFTAVLTCRWGACWAK
jgi:hypothetical protein